MPTGLQNSPQPTGFSAPESPSLGARGRERPPSLAWITDDLLAQTREVWSEVAGKPVDEDEAVEILLNVKRLAETMWHAAQENGGRNERGDLGTGLVAGAA